VRKVLFPSDSYLTKIEKKKNFTNEYFGFKHEKTILLFEYFDQIRRPQVIIEQLLALSHKELISLVNKIKMLFNNKF